MKRLEEEGELSYSETKIKDALDGMSKLLSRSHLSCVRKGCAFNQVEAGMIPKRTYGYAITPGPVDELQRANRAFLRDQNPDGDAQVDEEDDFGSVKQLQRNAQGEVIAEVPPNLVNIVGTPLPVSDHFVVEVVVVDRTSMFTVKEVWHFLPHQPIVALGDVLSCSKTLMPYPFTKNAFYFIGGAFYLDDRHDGWADLSKPIREWNPLYAASGPIFAECPVRSASATTFEDLAVTLGEHCCFRHLGSCDHLFYFRSVERKSCRLPASNSPAVRREAKPATKSRKSKKGKSGASDPTETQNEVQQQISDVPQMRYPYLVQGWGEKALLCEVCKTVPSTIASYHDRLTAANPTAFCKGCYEVLHRGSDGKEVLDGAVKLELPNLCYFTQ